MERDAPARLLSQEHALLAPRTQPTPSHTGRLALRVPRRGGTAAGPGGESAALAPAVGGVARAFDGHQAVADAADQTSGSSISTSPPPPPGARAARAAR